MKRATEQSKLVARTSREQKLRRHSDQVKLAKPGRSGVLVEKVLSLIKARPGIRPSEINRLLNIEQSDGARDTLLKRGLVRKIKEGSVTRYYPL
ncbi:MAG: hypothetical protein ACREPY_12050 [Rhodanobacteraceae bacterium]